MTTTILLGVRNATASSDEPVTVLDILTDPRGTNLLEKFYEILLCVQ